tara:strand:+ start:67 stop:897 length:831 start_codon:yes stop_codon:yes gene_type:complete
MFLITRFTHGSAGKFLSTVLQTSGKVDHWSAIVQANKNNPQLLTPILQEYMRRSFPQDHTMHLRAEPMVPYDVSLYSAGYLRGNNITLDQYVKNAQDVNDFRLLSCIQNDLIPNIIFHKPQLPMFCSGSNVVTITVTSNKEKEWLYKTLWSKQFLETADGISCLISDPAYCNFASLPTVLNFNNEYKFDISRKDELYEKYVVNDHKNPYYFNPDKFSEIDSEVDNIFISLNDILIEKNFLQSIKNVFQNFDLGPADISLIKSMHEIWISKQYNYSP